MKLRYFGTKLNNIILPSLLPPYKEAVSTKHSEWVSLFRNISYVYCIKICDVNFLSRKIYNLNPISKKKANCLERKSEHGKKRGFRMRTTLKKCSFTSLFFIMLRRLQRPKKSFTHLISIPFYFYVHLFLFLKNLCNTYFVLL